MGSYDLGTGGWYDASRDKAFSFEVDNPYAGFVMGSVMVSKHSAWKFWVGAVLSNGDLVFYGGQAFVGKPQRPALNKILDVLISISDTQCHSKEH